MERREREGGTEAESDKEKERRERGMETGKREKGERNGDWPGGCWRLR
jgi:hypothetical protein